MALDITALQADLDYMIADLPCTLVWGAQTITATRSERNLEDDVAEEGIYRNVDLELVASVDDFDGGTLPDNRTVVTVDGVKYYIQSQLRGQDGVSVSLQLQRI